MPASRYAPTTYGSAENQWQGDARTSTPTPAPTRSRSTKTTRKRRRDPLWARLLVMFGALLMMASGASIVGEKILIKNVSDNLNTIEVLPQHKVSITGAVNILLMGIDRRDDTEPTRADSIIIMHIPASHDRAQLISLPRDSLVNIPPFPKTGYPGGRQQKVNAAFAYGSQGKDSNLAGGFELLAKTITSFTGIPIHAGAIVDFGGFKALVGSLGGVHMCVDEKTTSIHIGWDRNGKVTPPYANRESSPTPIYGIKPMVYNVGCRYMAPWEALDYVRQRDTIPDGDYGRQRHQQQFIKAVFKEALTKGVTNPTKIGSIIKAIGKALTLDMGGVPLETWVDSMGGVRDIELIKTNLNSAGKQFNPLIVNGQYQGEVLSPDTITLLRSVANDDVDTFMKSHPAWLSQG